MAVSVSDNEKVTIHSEEVKGDKRDYLVYQSWKWEFTANDTGEALLLPYWAEGMTIAVSGTFDSGTLAIQGALMNEESSFSTIRDYAGDDAEFTETGLKALGERMRYIRPKLTGAGGSADLTVLAGIWRS